MQQIISISSMLIVLVVGLYAWHIQSQLFVNWDVSALSHIAEKMLAGEKYGRDFLEANMPASIYLYILPVLASRLFSVSLAVSVKMFSVCFAVLSSGICCFLYDKYKENSRKMPVLLFGAMLMLVWLIFPADQFSQREHFFLMMIMPFLVLTAVRFDGEITRIAPLIMVFVGVMAGFGFSMKPHFILIFIVIEAIFFVGMKKGGRIIFPVEAWCAIAVLFCLWLAALIFHYGYFSSVFPVLVYFYYYGINSVISPFSVLVNFPFLFSVIALCIGGAKGIFWKLSVFEGLLLTVMAGFMIIYIQQKADWYYHILPCFSVAFILLMYLLWKACCHVGKAGFFLWNTLMLAGMAILAGSAVAYVMSVSDDAIHTAKQGDTSIMLSLFQKIPEGENCS